MDSNSNWLTQYILTKPAFELEWVCQAEEGTINDHMGCMASTKSVSGWVVESYSSPFTFCSLQDLLGFALSISVPRWDDSLFLKWGKPPVRPATTWSSWSLIDSSIRWCTLCDVHHSNHRAPGARPHWYCCPHHGPLIHISWWFHSHLSGQHIPKHGMMPNILEKSII